MGGREGGGIGGTTEEGGDFNLYYSTMHECLLLIYGYRKMAASIALSHAHFQPGHAGPVVGGCWQARQGQRRN